MSTSIGVGIAPTPPSPSSTTSVAEGAVAGVRQLAQLTTALEREAAAALLLRDADTAMYAAKGAGKNRATSRRGSGPTRGVLIDRHRCTLPF